MSGIENLFGSFGFEIITIFILILANGFFAASEIAIVSARHSRLQQQADAGSKSAQQALDLARNSDSFLAAVQVGITLVSTLAAAFGGASISKPLGAWLHTFPFLAPYAETLALGIVVILITYFSLVLGELVPKRLALQAAERVASFVAPFMIALSRIAHPVIYLLNFSTNAILRLLGRHEQVKQEITEQDIVYLAHESRTVESDEEEFISRVFRFTDQPVRAVMTPRTETVAIAVNTPYETIIETFLNSGYTRLPLYRDNIDNIIGILHAKDLLGTCIHAEQPDLEKLARPPLFVPEYQHVDKLLSMFRSKGIHLAIVTDEYSQVVGLVTLEDLLEELVGEIQDEYDKPEEQAFIQRADGSWLVDAMTDHETVREKIGLPPLAENERRDYQTLAGMLLAQSGRLLTIGDTVTIDHFVFEVIDMDGRRIDKVLIRPQKSE
jgi:putative hemolysin